MFLSNPARYLVVCILILGGGTGCSYWQNTTGHAVPTLESEPSVAPFSTKEPENYRALVVVTSGGTERRIFTAKKGGRSRVDYDYGTPGQRTVVRSDTDFVYSERLQIYAETRPAISAQAPSELENDVTASLLSSRPYTSYESLGRENGLSKFKAAIGETRASEAVVFVDDAIGLPVKQEFYSVGADGQKVLRYTVDVRDVELEAEDSLFAIPIGARKVQLAEFERMIRKD
jgi:hypothetical protein